MLDRSDLLHFTLHTVMHNLAEGMILVSVILFLFLLNVRAALIVALTIPFSLLFASIWLDLSHIPGESPFPGRTRFRNGGGRRGGHGRKHRPSHEPLEQRTRIGTVKTPAEAIREAAHEVQRPVFYAIAIIITAYMPIFTLQRVEGRLVPADGLDGRLRSAGRHDIFDSHRAGAGQRLFFRKGVQERRNRVMDYLTEKYRQRLRWAVQHRWVVAGVGIAALVGTLYLGFGGVIGAEFLPHLDEGAIWARGTLANSTSLSEGEKFTTNQRYVFASFPEVKTGGIGGRPARRRNRHRRIWQH